MSSEKPTSSRETFDKNEDSIALKKQEIAKALESGDWVSVATLAQEAKGMETAKSEMMNSAEDEALETNKQIDEAKAAEEKAQRVAAIAEAARLDAENSAKEAAALLEKLTGGNTGASQEENVQAVATENAGSSKEEAAEAEASLMHLFNIADLRRFGEGPELDSTIATIKGFDTQTQEKLAQNFFDNTIGRNISSTANAYKVYMEFTKCDFQEKFRDLEDARLKRAGYAGFTL